MTRCTTARRAEALGYRYEARLRGLEMDSIYLTTTEGESFRYLFAAFCILALFCFTPLHLYDFNPFRSLSPRLCAFASLR